MMKRVFFTVLLISVLVLGISGCAPAEEAPTTSGEVMKVAQYFWPGQFWIEIADSKGFFEEAGLNVELVDTNDDYFGSLKSTVDGNIDVNMFVLYDLIDFNAEGADLVSIINVDISAGADTIVSKKEIENVAGLRGKRIGFQKETYTDYMLTVVLERNGLSNKDVTTVEFKAENIQPFVDGDIDALVTYEPFSSEAIEKGDGRIVFDTSQIPGLIPDVMAFHRSFIDERPNDVQAYVNVWHKTTKFIKEHPDEAFQIIADIYDVPVGDVQAFTQDVKILDLEDNKIAFSYAAGFQSLHGTARQINDFMIEKGITDKTLDSTDFIDARFIRNVETDR
jgi:NitT/TauT family transport system substrate-binding protein